MGWLEEVWLAAGIKSANELAARMTADDSWPESVKIKPRSFGNRLRALDQHKGHAWWERRAKLIQLLATHVRRDRDELKRAIVEDRRFYGETTEATRWEIDSLGLLYPVRLGKDELPPGLPEFVMRPGCWYHSEWWQVTDRRSCELVGRWLAARGGVHYVVGDTWDEVKRALPREGTVFALLAADARDANFVGAVNEPELDLLKICVAAPFPWGIGSDDDDETIWEDMEPEPLVGVTRDLVVWINARTRSREPLLDSAHTQALETVVEQLCDGPVDAVDALVCLADLGALTGARFEARAQYLRAYLERRAVRLSVTNERVAAWVASDGAEVLLGVMRGLIGAHVEFVGQGLSHEQWRSFIPDRGVSPENLERAREQAAAGKNGKPRNALRAVEQLLEPAEYQTLGMLEDAGLLSRTSATLLELSPRWLGKLVHRITVQDIVNGQSASEIGALLFQDSLVELVLVILLDEVVAQGATRLIGLARRFSSPTSDTYTTAFHEACFRVLGLACAEGVELTKSEARTAWKLQLRTLLPGGPAGLPLPAVALDTSKQVRLGSDALFYLAASALSLAFEFEEPRLSRVQLHGVLVDMPHALACTTRDTLREGALGVIARLTQSIVLDQKGQSPKLAGASLAAVLYIIIGGADMVRGVSPEARRFILATFDGVEDPGRLQEILVSLDPFWRIPLSKVRASLWTARQDPSKSHAPISWMSRSPDAAAWLWKGAPDQAALRYIQAQEVLPNAFVPEVARVFSDECWSAWGRRWVEYAKQAPQVADDAASILVMASADIVLIVIREGLLSAEQTPRTLRELWRARSAVLFRAMRGPSSSAVRLVASAPTRFREMIVSYVANWEFSGLDDHARAQLSIWLRGRLRDVDDRELVLAALRRLAVPGPRR